VTEVTEVMSEGRVAVVTGAASGIGLGLSERFAAEGMRVVMADVEEAPLKAAADRVAEGGAEVLPMVTDVSRAEQVDALRDQTLAAFGAVHLLCNNAGVGGSHAPLWEIPQGEWEWILGVNLWGVINGVRSFMPALLDADAAYLVNTASIFGAFAGALGPYGISKNAVVTLTETLHFQLQELGSPVGLSVLCPGPVKTNFGTSERNRPASAGPAPVRDDHEEEAQETFDQLWAMGREPSEVAEIVVAGIRARRFYLLTSTNRNEAVRRRGEEIVAGGPPTPPFP
jgi:NAD(P)-dependent dehydrogenase (short-subunit alcohol dehydrogenase family)